MLLMSDLHAHNFNQFATTLPNGRNSRFQNILNVVAEAHEVCKSRGIKHLAFLGDMFHSRTKLDIDVFSDTWRAWKNLADDGIELLLLVGNHDQYDALGKTHSLEAFKTFAHVVDTPEILEFGGYTIAAHPFTQNTKAWKKWVQKLPEIDFLFFHQGVKEGKVGAFDISIKAEISRSDLPQTRGMVWGGHYHKYQVWNTRSIPKGFVGSPLQHSFGERLERKAFIWLRGLKKFERIYTTAPKFYYYEHYGNFQAIFSGTENDYVRVRCTPNQAKLVPDFVRVELIDDSQPQMGPLVVSELDSDRTLLEAYILRQENLSLDSDRLLEFGSGLLVEDE